MNCHGPDISVDLHHGYILGPVAMEATDDDRVNGFVPNQSSTKDYAL